MGYCKSQNLHSSSVGISLMSGLNSLRWRHNDHAGVSNHQPHGCLLNRLFRCKSKKTSKLRVTGHCAGNSPGTGEFPAQMASYAENVSIWWRHHVVGGQIRGSNQQSTTKTLIKPQRLDPEKQYDQIVFLQNIFGYVPAKYRPFCSSLNVLRLERRKQ